MGSQCLLVRYFCPTLSFCSVATLPVSLVCFFPDIFPARCSRERSQGMRHKRAPCRQTSSCSDAAGLLNHWQVKGTVGLVATSFPGSRCALQCVHCGDGCVCVTHTLRTSRPPLKEVPRTEDSRSANLHSTPAPPLISSPCTEVTQDPSQSAPSPKFPRCSAPHPFAKTEERLLSLVLRTLSVGGGHLVLSRPCVSGPSLVKKRCSA